MKHVAFLGDGEHTFALPFPLIRELEAKTGVGIAVLCHRVRTMTFSAVDLSETIRLALIGGGMEPKQAFGLTQTYVEQRPLGESLPVVAGILEAVWFGAPATDEADNG